MSETTSTEATPADSSASDTEAMQLLADAVADDTSSDTDGVDYKALYEAEKARYETEKAEKEKWRSHSRKHEERARTNAEAASKAKTIEEQVAELQKKISDGEAAALVKSGRLAVTQVQAKLASSGFKPEDFSGLFDLIPPASLLKDGEPDDEAIDKLASSLIKGRGRVDPDPDQGRRGGKATDMNALLRKAVGR